MSILIADSGATKTEWYYQSGSVTQTDQTEGLNPYYHSADSIGSVIEKELLPTVDVVDEIYFYGAGCDSEAKKKMIEQALSQRFSTAEVQVHHDLLAAARACLGNEAGIACILGTGSNSCLYDGSAIVEHIPSLAFILGDEGSAAYFGKQLINRYFRDELPDDLQNALREEHNMSLNYITTNLYDGSQKSRFIASYGAFLGNHAEHPYIRKMLYKGFENFVRRIVAKYSNAADYEVRFVGSVAYAHQQVIKEILQEHGLTAGLFIRHPMERLVEYHT
ncbi:BadF-type ATPase [Fodinibius salinus]|uniref:BadF-type ATPase n=1 Tax=Fodinibius salinus TaxID=860790 RepID=A0A5D3YG05_9BACT|nr:hypothetical protein [Fodinibius salinus]TYP92613.1 BadF-type ATPase [Fodinibius salinus]